MMAGSIRRLLIANRGEIAIRIARTCRDMGISSVAVYSDADVGSLHVTAADAAVRIGPSPPKESYLSMPAILTAARSSGADAIHPGYGFLSENAAFARAVEAAGLIWVGPPPETQEALGNKLAARRAVEAAGVPIVPGSTEPLAETGSDVGGAFPSMLKAAAGGGGRGMRLVHDAEDLARALPGARREATSAFGDGTLYLEQLIRPAHHVEVQLLGDHQGRLAVLGERDCSVQRRHQKLVEESPSPAVGPDLREALFESARTVASTVLFHNAATVEFLVDDAGNHYFLEMNTRLQVEHGVTELVTGLDLVAWQLMIAAGEGLADDVLDIVPRGHAIQARVYAEDPYSAFSPVGGTVSAWWAPGGPGIRVDAAVQPGAPLATDYDPLLAKILVLASDRPAAVARLRRALDETVIGGLQTDLGFHRWLVDDQAFATGQYDTGLVEDRWGHGPDLSDEDRSKAAFAAMQGRLAASAGSGEAPSDSPDERPWTRQARQEALRGDR